MPASVLARLISSSWKPCGWLASNHFTALEQLHSTYDHVTIRCQAGVQIQVQTIPILCVSSANAYKVNCAGVCWHVNNLRSGCYLPKQFQYANWIPACTCTWENSAGLHLPPHPPPLQLLLRHLLPSLPSSGSSTWTSLPPLCVLLTPSPVSSLNPAALLCWASPPQLLCCF